MEDNQTYEDWKKIVEKLKKEVANAKQAIIDISIAKECQTKLLEYAETRLKDYPEPIMMAKDEEKTEEAEEEKEEEPAAEPEALAE